MWLFKMSAKEKLLSLMEGNGLSSVEMGLARDALKDPVARRRMCGGRPFDVSLRDTGVRLAGATLLCNAPVQFPVSAGEQNGSATDVSWKGQLSEKGSANVRFAEEWM